MKFKISEYHGSPCWRITGRWVYFDAEWNTRFPFGTCLCLRIGPHRPWPEPDSKHRQPVCGLTLDANAPLGEPNRLYLWGATRERTIGLIDWHTFRETGRREGPNGTVIEGEQVRCRPRLVRAQAWDWKRSENKDRWLWITVRPNDHQERWARAHPAEAAAAEDRRREWRQMPRQRKSS